jgi:hypothetical protein
MQFRSIKLRGLALALALAAGATAASCGGDSKKKESPPPSGAAGKPALETKECGGEICEGVYLVKGWDPIQPCCAEGDVCGLDSSFLASYGPMFSEACQAHNQPGEDGHGCPDSPALTVPNTTFVIKPLKGCCRTETHTCGYRLEKLLDLFDVSLGCVDSAPFLDGGAAPDCDPESP